MRPASWRTRSSPSQPLRNATLAIRTADSGCQDCVTSLGDPSHAPPKPFDGEIR